MGKNKTTNGKKFYVDIVVVGFSLISLIISVKSYNNSNEALELSKQDFIGERKLILKGEFNKNNTSVAIKSSNSNLVTTAGITFPTEFNIPEIIIRESDSTFSLLPIRNKLKQHLIKPTFNLEVQHHEKKRFRTVF